MHLNIALDVHQDLARLHLALHLLRLLAKAALLELLVQLLLERQLLILARSGPLIFGLPIREYQRIFVPLRHDKQESPPSLL